MKINHQPLFESGQQLLIARVKEQIQEDIITYAAISTVPTKEVDALCQIIVDNFNTLEK
jgi:hypothetical protein